MTNIRGLVAQLKWEATQQLDEDIEAAVQRWLSLQDQVRPEALDRFCGWIMQGLDDPEYEPSFEQALALVECWQGG